MTNVKPAGSDRFVQFVLGLFANERMKFALSDLIEKRAYLLLIALNPKFYATVRQVAHPTSYVKAFGGVTHTETEPNALDVTFIKHLKRDHDLLQVRIRASSIYMNRRDRNCLPGLRPNRRIQSIDRCSRARNRRLLCLRYRNSPSSFDSRFHRKRSRQLFLAAPWCRHRTNT